MKLAIALCCALVAGISLKAAATAAIWTVEIIRRDRSDEARKAMEAALDWYKPEPIVAAPAPTGIPPEFIGTPLRSAPWSPTEFAGEPYMGTANPAIKVTYPTAEADWEVPPGYDPSKPYYGEPARTLPADEYVVEC